MCKDDKEYIEMLRDHFAAKSLPAVMMARALDPTNEMNQESIAEECYDLADALLLEREQRHRPGGPYE